MCEQSVCCVWVQTYSLPGQEPSSRAGTSRAERERDNPERDLLLDLMTFNRTVRERHERVSQAVMDRPGIFQLMAQVLLSITLATSIKTVSAYISFLSVFRLTTGESKSTTQLCLLAFIFFFFLNLGHLQPSFGTS